MANQTKITLIADNLYYPIEISKLEKEISSTQLFGRLHNILQNSTAYLTYPSNRTSRFSHSLGCMYLTGQLVKYSIINAKKEDRGQFISDIKNVVENVTGDIKKMIWKSDNIDSKKFDEWITPSTEAFDDPFYCSFLPGVTTDIDNYYFILIFQAIRLVALLHDLGHPPFSHISELALSELVNSLQVKEEEKKEFTTNEKMFLDSYKKLTHFNGNDEEPLHEVVGLTIAEKLLDIELKSENLNQKEINKYIIFQLTKMILENKNPFFVALHKLVNSDLDTDRLDFVSRDLAASGLGSDNIKYGRLIASFQLVYDEFTENNKKTKIPKFLPSVRALSTIEKVFHDRMSLYKYVIFHHSVAKTDCLLKEIIINLAKENFKTNDNFLRQNDELPSDISGLWVVYNDQVYFKKELINNFIQWDDSWLLSVLRKHYFKIIEKEALTLNEIKLKIQLEEILSNKKHYISLFKRVDSFIHIDQEFLSNIPQNYDWEKFINLCQKFNPTIPLNKEKIKPLIETIDKLKYYHEEFFSKENNSKDNTDRISSLRESEGFFLSKLIIYFKQLDFDPYNSLDFFQTTCNEFKNYFQLNDTIIMPRNLKPGITRDFEIIVDNNLRPIQSIQSVSRIVDEMFRSALLFPPFYVFFYKENFIEDQNTFSDMQKKFGELLWNNFSNWLEKQLRS